MMYADYHVHTEFSDDSVYEMEAVVQDAIALGIEELCFTDHVDYGIKKDWDEPGEIVYRGGGPGEPANEPLANVDYPAYVEKIGMLQEKYKDRITLKLGLEFGMQQHTVPKYEALFKRYPFDFIILSVHEVEDKEFWTGDFQEGRTRKECYERYYNEILALVENYRNYSVLGHMDLYARYDSVKEPFPFEEVRPIIEKILKRVIADGKGIEVNTSCYRYGLSDLTPSRDILKLYKELGGTIITVGSDSHKKAHLGAHIQDTCRILKEMGFTSICTYEQMKPIFHELH